MEQVRPVIEKQDAPPQHDRRESDDKSTSDAGSGSESVIKTLASRSRPYETGPHGPITEALLHFLWIKRRRVEDLDDIATQPSVYDRDHAEYYIPKEEWEVSTSSHLV